MKDGVLVGSRSLVTAVTAAGGANGSLVTTTGGEAPAGGSPVTLAEFTKILDSLRVWDNARICEFGPLRRRHPVVTFLL
jgi:hypothetical protein